MRFLPYTLACCLGLSAGSLQAHPASKELSNAARAFVTSLTDEQKTRAVYPATDAERENWHYVPKDRNGLMLKEMTAPQREKAMALLKSGLSERGHMKAEAIFALEKVLFEIEHRDIRDAGRFTVTVFGTPGSQGLWGWRFEGHHLSVNFTLVGDTSVSATPSFFGSNPGEVRSGPSTGKRALAEEEDLGRAMLASFTAEQRQVVVFDQKAPKEIITTNQRRITLDQPVGLAVAKMTKAQSEQLRELVKMYVFRLRTDVARDDLKKIMKAGWDKVYFGWAGGDKKGEGHYYRIQGPTFIIEYDNVQNDANHVHTVWRDPEADFGRDVLGEHYAKEHKT